MYRMMKITVILVMGLTLFFSAAFARAVWVEGRVTRTPWKKDREYLIQVDKTTYTVLPDIRITRRVLRNPGAWDEKSASIRSIFTNQKIMVKVHKNKVIQIILF